MGNLANIMVEGDIRQPDNNFRAVSIDQSTICITHDEVCWRTGCGWWHVIVRL